MSDGFVWAAVDRIEARCVPFDWPWARREAAFIAKNWERRLALGSGIFDGRVLLACGWRVAGGTCAVDLFETRYSHLLGHRDAGSPDGGVRNVFSAIVPRSADGAILLGIMGGHTANAGQAYFPCGTPDRDDIDADGTVDLPGSAIREFAEETGMMVPADAPQSWTVLEGEGQLALLRPVAFAETADALLAGMERHREAEIEPELAGFLVARSAEDGGDARMPAFVRSYLARAFGA